MIKIGSMYKVKDPNDSKCRTDVRIFQAPNHEYQPNEWHDRACRIRSGDTFLLVNVVEEKKSSLIDDIADVIWFQILTTNKVGWFSIGKFWYGNHDAKGYEREFSRRYTELTEENCQTL